MRILTRKVSAGTFEQVRDIRAPWKGGAAQQVRILPG